MSFQKHQSAEAEEEEYILMIESFYTALVAYLHLQGKKKLGVKSLPEKLGHSAFCMWISQLDLGELQSAKAFFYDSWNFETNSELDRALFVMLDKWEEQRRIEFRPQS